MDEIEIEIPDVEIIKKKISKQYNCIVCHANFKNKCATINHMKRTHFKHCNKKNKHWLYKFKLFFNLESNQ